MTADMDRFRRTLEDGVENELNANAEQLTKSIVATLWNACDDERGRLLEENEKLSSELERAKRPSYSSQHVWMVWQEERPIHALYATEDDAKQGSIDCWEEDEPSCPDYSWAARAGGGWELVVGGDLAEVYVTRMDVFSKAMADEREAAQQAGPHCPEHPGSPLVNGSCEACAWHDSKASGSDA